MLTGQGDYEPMIFDISNWRACHLAATPAAVSSTAQAPAPPQCSLTDDCLRDMVELSLDGFRVDWPHGLDVLTAQAVLRARLNTAAASSARAAPIPVSTASLDNPDLIAPVGLQSYAIGHPPGVYSPSYSPDGATREVQTRRICASFKVDTSCLGSEVALTVESPSLCTASLPLNLDGSLPNSAPSERVTLFKPIRETSIEAQRQ